jgi:hypothetical protein
MIIILVLIGMTLLVLGIQIIRAGNYLGCLFHIAATVIFVITGIYYVRHDETLIGIFQFLAAFGALMAAIYGKGFIDDYYD